MKITQLVLIAAMLAGCGGGFFTKKDPATGEVVFDRAALHAEFVSFNDEATELQQILPPEHHLSQTIAKTQRVVKEIDGALMAGDEPQTLLDALDVALAAIPAVEDIVDQDPNRQLQTRIAVYAARAFLRHVKRIAAPSAPVDPETPPSGTVSGLPSGPVMVVGRQGQLLLPAP